MTDELEDILDRAEQQSDEVPTLPAGTTARQALEMEMRGEIELTPRQHNAAKVLIEYQEPRLSAVAVGHMDGTSFAAALERCLARSAQVAQSPPKTLPAPVVGQTDTQLDHSKPFVLRRRNLR